MEYAWWEWGTGQDYKQNQAINQLEMQLSYQETRNRRVITAAQERSRKLAGDLAGLAARVDEFIEYTDLRFQQLNFAHIARARSAVNDRFAALASGETLPTGDLIDIPGYWLPPAARGILSQLTGSGPIESDMDSARMRDRLRTELFQLSAGLCFERPDLAGPVVDGVLRQPLTLTSGDDPQPGATTEVASAWRDLWCRTAAGEFGPAAINRLRSRLAPAAAELVADMWHQQIGSRWANASEALVGMRRILADLGNDPTPRTVDDDVERWRQTLQELVTEGFGAERSILIRLAQIRDSVEDNDRPGWQRPVGTVADLLAGDLLDESAPPQLRRLALSLCADDLVLAVAGIADNAKQEMPVNRTVRAAGIDWTITPDTTVDAAELERSIGSQYPVVPTTTTLMVTILTAVVTVVMIPVLPGLAVMSGVVFLVSLLIWWKRRQAAARSREEYEYLIGKAQTQLRKAHDRLVADRRRAQDDTARAVEEHARLVKLLAPYCTRQPTRD